MTDSITISSEDYKVIMSTRPTMEVRKPPQYVIEFPYKLSAEAIEHIRRYLESDLGSGKPLILQEGARIRAIGADGTVSPFDGYPSRTTPLWAIAVGSFGGGFIGSVIVAVLT